MSHRGFDGEGVFEERLGPGMFVQQRQSLVASHGCHGGFSDPLLGQIRNGQRPLGQGGDARAVGGEQFFDGSANVVARRQMAARTTSSGNEL